MRTLTLLRKTIFIIGLLVSVLTNAQEGTKQFMPNETDRLWLEIYRNSGKLFATQSATDKERLYVTLNKGEKLHFGMKIADYEHDSRKKTSVRIKDESGVVKFTERRVPGSGSGYISSYSEAVTGPEGVVLNGVTISSADGYTPYVYTAESDGNHYIEFETWEKDYGNNGNSRETRRFAFEFFDVTVTDENNNVITNPGEPNVSAGRLWSKGWAFTTTSYTSYPVKADFYVFTADEFVNKVQYEMKPYSFNFVANSYGVSLDVDDNIIEKAQSQDGDLTNTSDISEYRIFLNDPDRSIWQNTALPPPTVKVWFDDNLIFDYDYDRNPQQLSIPQPAIVLEKNSETCEFESVTMFKVETNIDGFAHVLIDIDKNGYSTDGNDRALEVDLKKGVNYILWDFKNDNGQDVPDGSYTASATFLGRGPANFPLYDVESLSGISTYSIRPFNKLGPTLYWDDSQIPYWGDASGAGSMDETAQKQLTVNNHLPRVWTYDGSTNASSEYNGNFTTMNSWFNAIDLGMPLISFDVTTSTTKCVNGEAPVLGDVHMVAGIDEKIEFAASDFTDKYYDPNDLALTEIKILTLPAGGQLKLSGALVSINQVIPVAQIANLEYTPPSGFGGKYSFDFSASNGTNYALQSSIVYLVSNSAPEIDPIADQSICTNEGLVNFNITIRDNETAAEDLTVIAYSHDPLAVENEGISLTGTGSTRQLNVLPIADQSGYAIIYVLVDDGYSQTIEEFALYIGPSVLFSGDLSVCDGGTLSLTAEEVGATYAWKKGATTISTDQQLVVNNVSISDAGTYSLTVNKGTCEITREFEVSIAPLTTFTGDVALCVGELLDLSADETVAQSYVWKQGSNVIGTTKVLNVANMPLGTASDYTLYVKKEGCENTSPAFTVSVIEMLDNTLTVEGSQIVQGDDGTITIKDAEDQIVYSVYGKDDEYNVSMIATGNGTGGDLVITIPAAELQIGTNEFKIVGANANCSLELTNKGAISVNAIPTVSSYTETTNEDTPLTGNLLSGASDDDGGNLSVTTTPVVPPVNGSVLINGSNGSYTYTPNANYNGADSFTFRVCDDQNPNACATAVVNITVSAVNDAPTVSSININADEDATYVFTSSLFTDAYADVEAQGMTKIQVASLPSALAGELQLSGSSVSVNQEIAVADIANLRFVPKSNWNGSTSFNWKASDGSAYSSSSSALISVSAQDDKPSVSNGTASVAEDATNNTSVYNINDQLTGNDNDIDGEKITYSILSGNTGNAFKIDSNTGVVAVNTTSAIDFETQETYSLVVRATDTNGSFKDATITINVQNTDSDIVLTIADSGITEGNSGTSNMTFTVTASETLVNNLSFSYAIAEQTATYPEDYTVESGSATMLSGTKTVTFNIPIVGDAIVETNETFEVSLNSLSAGTTSGTAQGLITDNDNAVLTISDAAASEGNGKIDFTVKLTGAVQGGLTVGYDLSDVSATGGDDYNEASGTVVFAGTNNETKVISVPISNDNIVELQETFQVSLSTSKPSVNADDKAIGTINDNDGTATLYIGNKTLNEDGSADFEVSVDKPVQGGFVVNYSAIDGTAELTSDFTLSGSSLSFSGIVETKSFKVNGVDDAVVEGSENFTIKLTSPSGLVDASSTAVGTIIDNDVANVTVEDVDVTEGGTATFTLKLNKAVDGGMTISYSLNDNGADKSVDYNEPASRDIKFAGTANETHTFTVSTKEDDIVEASEEFIVTLESDKSLVGVDDVATGTIIDNDGVASITVSNIEVNEGDNARFALQLDKAVQGGVTINYATSNNSAISSQDYTAKSSSVTFDGTANEIEYVTISTLEDAVVESSENFTIGLTEAHDLVSVTASASATIKDDDGVVNITITNASFNENGTGTFTVSSDKAVQGGFIIKYTFENGTAVADSDFDDAIVELDFTGAAGEKQYITVDGIEDALLEGTETFNVRLSSLSTLVNADKVATGTIIDNDVATLTIDDVVVNENETATFKVTLDNDVQGGFIANYSFENGTATGGVDFATLASPLLFAGTKGESKTFDVTISNDGIVENSESFTVKLTTNNALIDASDVATCTINDIDGPAQVTISDIVVTEGSRAEVILKLDKAVQGAFFIECSTSDGTAEAGSDYLLSSSSVEFSGALNETQSFFIDGKIDDVVEGNEDFAVIFKSLSGLVNVSASSKVTIADDDGQATISVDNVSVDEDGSASFLVKSDKAVQGGFTLSYSFINGTAIGGTDFDDTEGSKIFVGDKDEEVTIVVATTDDFVVEPSENYTIKFSSTNPLINTDDTAVATINDNDNSQLTISNVSSIEDGSLTFEVALGNAVAGGTTVTYSFTDVTAIGGTDYDDQSGTLLFVGDEFESKTFTVSLTDDLIVENDETFIVGLESSNSLVGDDATAIGTIENNDGMASITVADISISEDEKAIITLVADKAVQGGYSISYATSSGTAIVGSDLSSTIGKVDFDGSLNETKTIEINTIDDLVVEKAEGYTINYTSNSPLVSAQPFSKVSINDNDGVASVSVTDVTINEGGTGEITLKLDKAVEGGFDVSYVFTDVETSGTLDYQPEGDDLSFNGDAGEEVILTIATLDDDFVEGNETFTVAYTASSSLVSTTEESTVSIIDEDSANLTIEDVVANENESMTFTVKLNKAVAGGLIVEYVLNGSTAISDVDYNNIINGQLTFVGTANEEQTFTVTLIDDDVIEASEQFTVALTSRKPAVGDDDTATGTIVDNDGTAMVTVSNITVDEDQQAVFTLTLDKDVQDGVDIDYQTNGASASGVDFTAQSGTIGFAGIAGEIKQVTIDLVDDDIVENHELFTIDLSEVHDLVSVTASASATIKDNDGKVTLSVNNLVVAEDGSAKLQITADKALEGGFDVTYSFVDGTAEGGIDYNNESKTIFFEGKLGEMKEVTISAIDDFIAEQDEDFQITLSSTNDLVDANAVSSVTITDNDMARVSVEDVTLTEGGVAVFTVTLDSDVVGGTDISYTFEDGTAVVTDDYSATIQTLKFAGDKGETHTFSVTFIDDDITENTESFTVKLSSSSSLVNADDTAIGTIEDNDAAKFVISDQLVNEGDIVTVTITLDNDVAESTILSYSLTDVEAEENSDYTYATGQFTFTGDKTQSESFDINITDDLLVEGVETFVVKLSSDNTLYNASAVSTISITDNDVAGLSIVESDNSTNTGEDGSSDSFAVVLTSRPQSDVIIDVQPDDATEGAATPLQLTFTTDNWNTPQEVTITGQNDDEVDGTIVYNVQVLVNDLLSDSYFRGLSQTVQVSNADDEIANYLPQAIDDSYETKEDTPLDDLDVLANDLQLDDGGIVVSVSMQPTNALVTVNADNTLKVVPQNNFFGEVSFEYLVCDGENDCSAATVTVTITPVNDAPELQNDLGTVSQDQVLNGANLLSNDSDPENDKLIINTTPVVNVSNGTLVINSNGTYTYTPNEGFFGSDEFTYEVCDDGTPSECATTTVSIIVSEKIVVNIAPNAVADVYEVGRNEVLNAESVLENDSDENEDDVLYVTTNPVVAPTNGTLTLLSDGTFTYQPEAEFEGTDEFTYQVCDDGDPQECSTARVTINVVVKDSDGDTLPDDIEGDDDVDNDGTPNYLDLDSDGDGESDEDEGLGDCDNDGIANFIDADRCYEDYPLNKGFSPNGDGINDVYEIPWLTQFTQVSIEVFNRWGNVVYEASKYDNDWDGTSNAGFTIGKELPVGTYFYIITIKDTKQTLKGYIYLNR